MKCVSTTHEVVIYSTNHPCSRNRSKKHPKWEWKVKWATLSAQLGSTTPVRIKPRPFPSHKTSENFNENSIQNLPQQPFDALTHVRVEEHTILIECSLSIELDFCLHYLSTLLGSIIIVDHYHHARCSIAQVREPGWSMRSVSLPHHSRGACEPACLPACLLDDMSTPNHLFVMLYVHLFLRFLDKHHTSEPLSFYYL